MAEHHLRIIYDNTGLWREYIPTNQIANEPVVMRNLFQIINQCLVTYQVN